MKLIRLKDAQRHDRKATELADAKDWAGAREEFVTAASLYGTQEAVDLQAKMLSAAALCDFALGRLPEALASLRRSADLMASVKDVEGEATAILESGHVLLKLGRADEAETAYERALRLFRSEDNHDGLVRVYRGLENLFRSKCDDAKAEEMRDRCEAARRLLAAE